MAFNINEARKSGYSDQEIINYFVNNYPQFKVQDAIKSGYSIDEIANKIDPPVVDNEKRTNSSFAERFAGASIDAIKNSTRKAGPILANAVSDPKNLLPLIPLSKIPYSTMDTIKRADSVVPLEEGLPIVGGIAAAPFGPVMSAGGAMLGSGAKDAVRWMRGKETGTPMQMIGSAGVEGAMSLGGELALGPVIKGANKLIGKTIPKVMVNDVLNVPRIENAEALKKGAKTISEKAIDLPYMKGSAEEIYLKAGNAIKESESKIKSTIASAKDVKIDPKTIFESLTEKIQNIESKGARINEDLISELKKVRDAFAEDIDIFKSTSLSKIQEYKRQIYNQLTDKNWYTNPKNTPERIEALKTLAGLTNKSLEAAAPSLKKINQEYATHIGVKEALAKTLAKNEGRLPQLYRPMIDTAETYGAKALSNTVGKFPPITSSIPSQLGVRAGANFFLPRTQE